MDWFFVVVGFLVWIFIMLHGLSADAQAVEVFMWEFVYASCGHDHTCSGQRRNSSKELAFCSSFYGREQEVLFPVNINGYYLN